VHACEGAGVRHCQGLARLPCLSAIVYMSAIVRVFVCVFVCVCVFVWVWVGGGGGGAFAGHAEFGKGLTYMSAHALAHTHSYSHKQLSHTQQTHLCTSGVTRLSAVADTL